MRETEKVSIEGIEFELYREPTYGDELYIEEERVKFDAAIGSDNRPKIGSYKVQNPDLLKLERAIKGWSLPGLMNRETIRELPLKVAHHLIEHLKKTEWASLGEVISPPAGIGN